MQMKLGHVKLGVSDIKRSVEWYTQVLGFEVDSFTPKDEPTYYDFKGTGATFSIGQAEHSGIYHGGRTNFEVEDVDGLWESLKGNATVVESIWDTPWGTRKFTIADPDGNELGFSKQV
ncbi:VOC family protein [Acutalibacter sp. 1XD8-36]|uniref:VOC family protein n=1 Tax=Acutalibacter sp. 1XD8-36 TaxID=2320852 RepID=UPI001412AE47|nr:VOC family protein [Acutalibacter sp. 1XD8-36]NBJ89817.1 VOC family protein [Acutalibacter sp. 1XD8-36]